MQIVQSPQTTAPSKASWSEASAKIVAGFISRCVNAEETKTARPDYQKLCQTDTRLQIEKVEMPIVEIVGLAKGCCNFGNREEMRVLGTIDELIKLNFCPPQAYAVFAWIAANPIIIDLHSK